MGCNCKANEKILNIHKKYGQESWVSNGHKIKFRIVELLKLILLFLICLFFLPLIIIIVIIISINGKGSININQILKIFLNKK
jgi:lipopolysaccharide/colanic/teichoic acid biosynthesis glycosyltransferase